MNKEIFKSKARSLMNYIPKNKWIEIPIEDIYWHFFNYPGLYAVYNGEKLLYIGVSINLGTRLKDHFSDGLYFDSKEKVSKIKIKVFSNDYLQIQEIEDKLLYRLKPKFNKKIPIWKPKSIKLKMGI